MSKSILDEAEETSEPVKDVDDVLNSGNDNPEDQETQQPDGQKGQVTHEQDEDAEHFGGFPSHVEFVRMLREAQKLADETNDKVPINWRGYKSSVFPHLPRFTVKCLKERLKFALKGILDISAAETKVISRQQKYIT